MGIKKLLGGRYFVIVVILYTGIITWLSLAQINVSLDVKINASDKIGHFIAYFGFAIIWFVFFYFSIRKEITFFRSLLLASIVGAIYGGLMEICQAVFTTYRTPEWYDIAANVSGVFMAVFFLKLIENKIVAIKE